MGRVHACMRKINHPRYKLNRLKQKHKGLSMKHKIFASPTGIYVVCGFCVYNWCVPYVGDPAALKKAVGYIIDDFGGSDEELEGLAAQLQVLIEQLTAEGELDEQAQVELNSIMYQVGCFEVPYIKVFMVSCKRGLKSYLSMQPWSQHCDGQHWKTPPQEAQPAKV